jgi:hypothetical protein
MGKSAYDMKIKNTINLFAALKNKKRVKRYAFESSQVTKRNTLQEMKISPMNQTVSKLLIRRRE